VTVTNLAEFTAAVTDDTTPRIIVVSGTITGAARVRLGSNKSLIGLPGSKLVGVSVFVWKHSNVIIRNIKSEKVLASTGDAILIQESTNVWVDHWYILFAPLRFSADTNKSSDLSSALVADKDFYDGLLDVTHGSRWVTISNTYLHNHWKTSLVGHSENNGVTDKCVYSYPFFNLQSFLEPALSTWLRS